MSSRELKFPVFSFTKAGFMFSLKLKETHFVYFAAIGLSLFWYVSHTSQIAALGYVSDTNYIVEF